MEGLPVVSGNGKLKVLGIKGRLVFDHLPTIVEFVTIVDEGKSHFKPKIATIFHMK